MADSTRDFYYSFQDGSQTDTIVVTVNDTPSNSTGYGLGYAVVAIHGQLGNSPIQGEVGQGGVNQTNDTGNFNNTIFTTGAGDDGQGGRGNTYGLDFKGIEFAVNGKNYNLYADQGKIILADSATTPGVQLTPLSQDAPCFCTGTLIRTPRGDVAVESLAIGDLVVTASGAERSLKWIGHRTVDCRDALQPEAVRPVCICAGAIAPGLPRRDLLVSPDHAFFFDDILVPAKSLINGSTVEQVRAGVVTYYALEFDTHDMVLAEGLSTESYFDDGQRDRFDNYSGDRSDLDPSKAVNRDGSYRPLVINGPQVAQVRDWINVRAEHLDRPPIYGLGKADLASDAELDRGGTTTGTIVGYLERISREEISGWVWTEGHPSEPVLIEIDLDGVTMATLRADEYRPDLHFANIGVGRHGFRLRLPPRSYKQRWMNVGVRVRSSGMHLTHSPAVIATETNEMVALV